VNRDASTLDGDLRRLISAGWFDATIGTSEIETRDTSQNSFFAALFLQISCVVS
jgi:hypothetical protein